MASRSRTGGEPGSADPPPVPPVADPYRGLAATYDAEYAAATADVAGTLRLLADHGPCRDVLELGCGTGRVAIPMAQAGLRVMGLDRSASMIRRARTRRRRLPGDVAARLRFSQQDMVSFRFPRRFDAILIPFSGLQLLPGPTPQAACLARCAAHLVPGGLLILDLASPGRTAPGGGREATRSTFRVGPYGHVVDKTVFEHPSIDGTVVQIRQRYSRVHPVSGRLIEARECTLDLYRVDLRWLEAQLGQWDFDVLAVLGGHAGQRWSEGSDRAVVVARLIGRPAQEPSTPWTR